MITRGPSINAQWRSRLSDDARRLVRLGIVGTNVVYRMLDCAGVLLYVGISRNLPSRLRAHVETQAWWRAVASIEIEVHHDRASAERAEVVAIWTENPVHNGTRYTWQSVCLQGHPGLWPLRPGPAETAARIPRRMAGPADAQVHATLVLAAMAGQPADLDPASREAWRTVAGTDFGATGPILP